MRNPFRDPEFIRCVRHLHDSSLKVPDSIVAGERVGAIVEDALTTADYGFEMLRQKTQQADQMRRELSDWLQRRESSDGLERMLLEQSQPPIPFLDYSIASRFFADGIYSQLWRIVDVIQKNRDALALPKFKPRGLNLARNVLGVVHFKPSEHSGPRVENSMTSGPKYYPERDADGRGWNDPGLLANVEEFCADFVVAFGPSAVT